MKCPDCAGSLVELTLTGIDKTHRCFRCGGIWIKDNTINELSARALEGWSPMQFDTSVLSVGTNRCPEDEQVLKIFENKSVGKDWNVRKCEVCKNWWWPTDTLFRIKDLVRNSSGYIKVGQIVTDVEVS